jgi:hypothetical protein
MQFVPARASLALCLLAGVDFVPELIFGSLES